MYAVLLLILVGRTYGCTREELEMVQIISVPGAHAPAFVYPEDPNPKSTWKEGLGDLTMLGKFQAYAMGVFLKEFYNDFINSDPRTLEVISASDKGAVKSAQSLVTALFTPTPYWEVVQNFSWQPIYIKYDNEESKFLSSRTNECPSASVDLTRIILRESEAITRTYQNLMRYWSMNSGMELKNIFDVSKLYSVLHTELLHNLTIPEWSTRHWNEIKYLHDVIHQSVIAKSKKAQRLFGGPLVHRTVEAMREKAINTDDPRKVIVYSSDKIPLFHFLQAMDIGRAEHLPPCATVLVELYKHEDVHFVRYLYVNSTVPEKDIQEVYSLTVPGCTEFCPLNYINEYTKRVIPKNWEQECLFI